MWLLSPVIVIVVVVLIAAVHSGNRTVASSFGNNASTATNTKAAKSACRDAVKLQLVSPATAHFHGETVSRNPDGGANVDGQVDSQNRFGAVLTSTFGCETDALGNVTSTPVLITH